MPRPELRWGSRSVRSVDGVDVHVETGGPADGPVVAALHGFGSGTFTWAGVAPGWCDHLRVVAWDRPPFGRSGRPAPGAGATDPYGPAAELARSIAVVDAERAGRPVVLVGHSAGAVHALELAVAGAVPLAGLVLVAPAVDGSPPPLVRALAGLPGGGVVGGAVVRLAALGAEPALKALSRHRTPLTDATAREAARLLRRRGTATALFHLTRIWRPTDVVDRLRGLDVPALVIGGADDRIVSPTTHETLADLLGAELHLLDDVGHAAHEQVPEVVGPLVGAFLDHVGR